MKSLIIAVVSVLLGGCHERARFHAGYDSTAERPVSAARDLKEFEGRYEYLHGASIVIGVSPRDGVLYAILDEAKYPLKRLSEGVFADRVGSRVVFERGESGRVSGYRLQQEKATNFFRRTSDA